jgi:NADH-quinone oxidoreductase subunit J
VTPLEQQFAFFSLAALMLISALRVVTARSILHAGFWLLPCFIGIAGMYALLSAHFFVVVQVLIYVGAILVLILFALMLTRDVMNPHVPYANRLQFLAGLICAGLALVVSWALARHTWPAASGLPAGPAEQTKALGEALIGLYAVPFEAASVLLLAALIGAIVLAKSEREPEPEKPPLLLEELTTEDTEEHRDLQRI